MSAAPPLPAFTPRSLPSASPPTLPTPSPHHTSPPSQTPLCSPTSVHSNKEAATPRGGTGAPYSRMFGEDDKALGSSAPGSKAGSPKASLGTEGAKRMSVSQRVREMQQNNTPVIKPLSIGSPRIRQSPMVSPTAASLMSPSGSPSHARRVSAPGPLPSPTNRGGGGGGGGGGAPLWSPSNASAQGASMGTALGMRRLTAPPVFQFLPAAPSMTHASTSSSAAQLAHFAQAQQAAAATAAALQAQQQQQQMADLHMLTQQHYALRSHTLPLASTPSHSSSAGGFGFQLPPQQSFGHSVGVLPSAGGLGGRSVTAHVSLVASAATASTASHPRGGDSGRHPAGLHDMSSTSTSSSSSSSSSSMSASLKAQHVPICCARHGSLQFLATLPPPPSYTGCAKPVVAPEKKDQIPTLPPWAIIAATAVASASNTGSSAAGGSHQRHSMHERGASGGVPTRTGFFGRLSFGSSSSSSSSAASAAGGGGGGGGGGTDLPASATGVHSASTSPNGVHDSSPSIAAWIREAAEEATLHAATPSSSSPSMTARTASSTVVLQQWAPAAAAAGGGGGGGSSLASAGASPNSAHYSVSSSPSPSPTHAHANPTTPQSHTHGYVHAGGARALSLPFTPSMQSNSTGTGQPGGAGAARSMSLSVNVTTTPTPPFSSRALHTPAAAEGHTGGGSGNPLVATPPQHGHLLHYASTPLASQQHTYVLATPKSAAPTVPPFPTPTTTRHHVSFQQSTTPPHMNRSVNVTPPHQPMQSPPLLSQHLQPARPGSQSTPRVVHPSALPVQLTMPSLNLDTLPRHWSSEQAPTPSARVMMAATLVVTLPAAPEPMHASPISEQQRHEEQQQQQQLAQASMQLDTSSASPPAPMSCVQEPPGELLDAAFQPLLTGHEASNPLPGSDSIIADNGAPTVAPSPSAASPTVGAIRAALDSPASSATGAGNRRGHGTSSASPTYVPVPTHSPHSASDSPPPLPNFTPRANRGSIMGQQHSPATPHQQPTGAGLSWPPAQSPTRAAVGGSHASALPPPPLPPFAPRPSSSGGRQVSASPQAANSPFSPTWQAVGRSAPVASTSSGSSPDTASAELHQLSYHQQQQQTPSPHPSATPSVSSSPVAGRTPVPLVAASPRLSPTAPLLVHAAGTASPPAAPAALLSELSQLRVSMGQAAAALRFEECIVMRDRIAYIERELGAVGMGSDIPNTAAAAVRSAARSGDDSSDSSSPAASVVFHA